jgi:hypothetical protein
VAALLGTDGIHKNFQSHMITLLKKFSLVLKTGKTMQFNFINITLER